MDLSYVNQYLLSGVQVQLKMHVHNKYFCLMYTHPTDTFHVDINDVLFRCKFFKPSMAISLLYSKALENRLTFYNYARSILKTIMIPKWLKSWSLDSLYTDNLLYEINVGLINANTYIGSPTHNPFHFQHFNLEFLSFQIVFSTNF